MKTRMAMLAASVLSAALSAGVAYAAAPSCPTDNGAIPPGANTTDPSAPFYIDTTHINTSTVPPTRDPSNPHYPRATALADGSLPSPDKDGNFILGPTHAAAPQTLLHAGVPRGAVRSFTMVSDDGTLFRPGVIRDDLPGCRNSVVDTAATAPGDPSDMIVTKSHAGVWRRTIDVYVPAQYRSGTRAPFIVLGDGGPQGFFNEKQLFTVLDNMIAARRLPPMLVVAIGSGGQDAQGAERGREYDTVSGTYGEWVEHEVLPRVEQNEHVLLTNDPNGRVTMGVSSSGVAAFTMAWFHPEWFRRVLAFSPTFVNQQWPHDTALPGGAWEYHSPWAGTAAPLMSVTGIVVSSTNLPTGAPLIPNTSTKPIRMWFDAGDRDLFYPVAAMHDGMHDWALANERMAAALAAKDYHYQFVFSRNAGHGDAATVAQTLPEALTYVWAGYKPAGNGR